MLWLPQTLLLFPFILTLLGRWVSYIASVFTLAGAFLGLFSYISLVKSFHYRTGLKSMPKGFYTWKIFHSTLLTSVLLAFLIYGYCTSKEFGASSMTGEVSVVLMHDSIGVYIWTLVFLLVLMYIIALFIWFVISFFKVRKSLKKQPYIICRFRHLAIHSIFYLIIIGIIYVVCVSIVYFSLAHESELASQFQRVLSTVKCFWFFLNLLVCYIFLPVSASGHSIDAFFNSCNGFSIQDTRFMILFASEAYRIASESQGLRPDFFGYKLLETVN